MAGARRLNSLADQILARAKPWLGSARYLVALSGGADSAVCAWAARELGNEVRTHFVNHGFPESDDLERSAREISTALEIPFSRTAVSVPKGPSPEAQARRARYEALEGSRTEDEWVLTGHTADDQAETVLSNLIRGAGLAGLAGIPVRRQRVIRPLLQVWRSETREMASLLRLPWRDDPTNRDVGIVRNSLRLQLIPEIEQSYNPAFRESLVRLAGIAGREREHLDRLAEQVPVTEESGTTRVPAGALRAVARPVAEQVLRSVLRQLHPPYGGGELDIRTSLAVALEGGDAHLSGGIRAFREGPWLVLSTGAGVRAQELTLWSFPGTARFLSWTLDAWFEEGAPAAFPLSAWQAVFDADGLPAQAEIRSATSTDVIAMDEGHKRVGQALAEAGVASDERDFWPVVMIDGEILWVPGVRSSQRHWVTLDTRRYLWVRAEREGS